MKALLKALVWLGVGIQLAFIAVMQTMTEVLAEDRAGLTDAAIAIERVEFFNLQTWSMIVLPGVLATEQFVSWRERNWIKTNG